jgi:sigma-E factor negative regulatory protein RseA
MTEQLRQSLSAVVDDEADAFELRRVLDELDRDPELRVVWERYHLIGGVIRRERNRRNRRAAAVVRERMAAELRGEADAPPAAATGETESGGIAASSSPVRGRTRLGRGTVLALAAAASLVVVLVVGFNVDDRTKSAAPAVAVAERTAPPAEAVGEPSPRPDLRSPAEALPSDLHRAHAYMLEHAQHQKLNQPGVMSLVKMATYEAP